MSPTNSAQQAWQRYTGETSTVVPDMVFGTFGDIHGTQTLSRQS